MVAFADESPQLGECAAEIEAVAERFAAIWTSPHSALDIPVPATQLRVLFILADRDGVNLSGLARELGSLLSSASRLCDRLEAAGLIVRESGRQSRREITIRLSPDGRDLLDRVRRHRRTELEKVLTAMPSAARADLLTGLTAFRDAVSEASGRTTAPAFRMPA